MFRRYRHFLIIVSLLILTACASAPPAFSLATPPVPTLATTAAQRYLETAFDFVQQNYVDRKSVDWPQLRYLVFNSVTNARTPQDTYSAIQLLIANLGNRHTQFLTPQQAANVQSGDVVGMGVTVLPATIVGDFVVVIVYPNGAAAKAGVQPGDLILSASEPPRGSSFDGYATVTLQLKHHNQGAPITVTLQAGQYNLYPIPDGKLISTGLGYINLPGFEGDGTAYATMAQSIIQSVDMTPICGWIVDLRFNSGGSFSPMIAGVGPIIGDGQLGAFIAPDSNTPWSYRNGQMLVGKQPVLSIASPYHLHHPNPPVAVLTSDLTASAAEATLISFEQRPETRVFGQATAGVPTANIAKTMSDNALLILTTAYEADRTGYTYPAQPIQPAQSVDADWTQLGTANDPVVNAATSWLRAQSACQAR